MADIRPFKIHIPDAELDLMKKKLELARLPGDDADEEWGEQKDNGVTHKLIRETVRYWREEYDWRAEEERLNTSMPQFVTEVQMPGFDAVRVHFAHVRCSKGDGGIPLLFLHGWPGSFMEVEGILPTLRENGFNVVAPSLAGYGFSGYPRQKGFNFFWQADTMHAVMQQLGYTEYVVQGGDWGSIVGRIMAMKYPKHIKALHVNLIMQQTMQTPTAEELAELTPFELAGHERGVWFRENESAYQRVQSTKPRTLGYALHDSPVGMLAWMADKLHVWSDGPNKRGGDGPGWSARELITWTLMHWLPGPTTAMNMYRENIPPRAKSLTAEERALIEAGRRAGTLTAEQQALIDADWRAESVTAEQRALIDGGWRVVVPTGVSHFAREIMCAPRRWVEREVNVVWWREHAAGGHFSAYERPADMAADLVEFFGARWKQ